MKNSGSYINHLKRFTMRKLIFFLSALLMLVAVAITPPTDRVSTDLPGGGVYLAADVAQDAFAVEAFQMNNIYLEDRNPVLVEESTWMLSGTEELVAVMYRTEDVGNSHLSSNNSNPKNDIHDIRLSGFYQPEKSYWYLC